MDGCDAGRPGSPKRSKQVKKKTCPHCGDTYHPWYNCPRIQRRELPASYGWKFARGQNDSRNQSFFDKAAADPFGVTNE
jgi:hypothetical protein